MNGTLLLPLLLGLSPSPAQAELSPAPAKPADPPAGAGLTLAVYAPFGELPEAPPAFDLNLLALDQPTPTSFYDLTRALVAARDDAAVPLVVFDPKDCALGFSQVQSLRRSFRALRDAGKEVWVYLDQADLGSLLLASEASLAVLMPEADVQLSGLYLEDLYFKGLFDKVGLQADIIHIGDYKAAGEPFTRSGPSEEARRQNEALLDSLYASLLDQICASRQIERAKLDALIERGDAKPADLVDAGLLDVLSYRTDFVRQARAKVGRRAAIDYRYGMPGAEELPNLSLDFGFGDLFGLGSKNKRTPSSAKAVGVVVFEGVVDASTVTPARTEILKAARDKSIRALVLRVNSPGGSALESEILWEATRRFQEARKPLVVSMGDVAASGGYYIAAGADAIFAEPGTVTGSIGVVGGKIVIKGLLDWAGVQTHPYQRGRHADALSSTRIFTDEQRALVRRGMEDVYRVFRQRVQDGRQDALKRPLDELAGGRVFTGAQALDLGLVDRLGGLDEAVAHAAELAKLDAYETRLLPEPKGLSALLESLLGTPPDASEDFVRLEAGGRVAPALARWPEPLRAAWEALALADPRLARAGRDFLRQASLLREGGVLLVAPPRLLRFR
jgi:protease-4